MSKGIDWLVDGFAIILPSAHQDFVIDLQILHEDLPLSFPSKQEPVVGAGGTVHESWAFKITAPSNTPSEFVNVIIASAVVAVENVKEAETGHVASVPNATLSAI